MAVIKFDKSAIVAYLNGGVATSKRIGYVNGKNLVVAVPFSTGNVGANFFSFCMTLVYNINNPNTTATGPKFAFAITKEDDISYKNYNGDGDGLTYNGAGDGCVIFTPNIYGTDYYDISGSVEKILMPNTKYVLWLFPNYKGMQISSSLSWNASGEYTYELLGAAGLIRIDTGNGIINAIPYIDDGSKYKQSIPYLDNSKSLEICE